MQLITSTLALKKNTKVLMRHFETNLRTFKVNFQLLNMKPKRPKESFAQRRARRELKVFTSDDSSDNTRPLPQSQRSSGDEVCTIEKQLSHEAASENNFGDVNATNVQDLCHSETSVDNSFHETLAASERDRSVSSASERETAMFEDGPSVPYLTCRQMSDHSSDISSSESLEPTTANSRAETMEDIGDFFVSIQSRRDCPQAVVGDILDYIYANKDVFCTNVAAGNCPPFRRTRTQALKKHCPRVLIDVVTEDENKAEVRFLRRERVPVQEIRRRKLKVVYTLFYLSLADIVKFHKSMHGNNCEVDEIVCSVDGVPESQSSPTGLEILSIQFSNCKTVYCVAVLKTGGKALGLPESIILDPLIKELTHESCEVRCKFWAADAPKRANLMGMTQHMGRYSCHYCYALKDQRVFPAATSIGCPRRTMAEIDTIVDRIQRNARGPSLHQDVTKGVKGPSPVRDLPGLDIVSDIPPESMHLVYLGVVRKMFKLTFYVVPKHRVPFNRQPAQVIDRDLLQVKVPTEFARRTRPMDPVTWKAQEWRNFCLCMFPIIIKHCPRQARKVWLQLVFIARALSLPDNFYRRVTTNVEELCKAWYLNFDKTFGKCYCSYNVHVMHHVCEVRKLGPLTETSAVRFEDHYAHLKKCFKAGTQSTGLQILQNSYLSLLSGHKCGKKLHLRTTATSQANDTIVYLKSRKFVKLHDMQTVKLSGTVLPVEKDCVMHGLNMTEVLVFKLSPNKSSKTVTFKRSDIIGKGVICMNFISVMTNNLLFE